MAVAGIAALAVFLFVIRDMPMLGNENQVSSVETSAETGTGVPFETETDAPEDDTPVHREPKRIVEMGEPLALVVGETLSVWPENQVEALLSGEVRLLSSDLSVISTDECGLVTAVGEGKAKLTIRTRRSEEIRTVTVTEPVISLRFETESYEMEKYSQVDTVLHYELGPLLKPEDIVYVSSDESVAKVDGSGRVLATGAGTAEITASIGDVSAVCSITVNSTLSSIGFSFSSMPVRIGDTVRLPLIYNPADTTSDTTTAWESSNPQVVTVDGNGVIRAVGAGSAVIRAVCGKFRAEATISVVIPVSGVTVSQTAMTLNKGASAALQASVVPGNTTEDRSITFSSDNASVARVDASGLVTAIAPGVAHVTANHGLLGAVCTVTVLSPLQAVRIGQETLSVIEGSSANLSVIFEPADTTDPKTVSWSSENPEIALIDENGSVTGVREGETVVTAAAGGFSASVTVKVLPWVEVESVTLSETEHVATSRGETFTLTAVVTPSDATEGTVTFQSSDENVATVDGAGLVKAVDRGTAVITATAGGKSAACTVTVDIPEPDKVVVLDPGHSSRFTGAYYFNRKEDELNLATALACKAYLEAHYAGVQVYLTRSDGQPVNASSLSKDLEDRAQFAQDHGADVLVSLHYNASTNHSASGALVFVSAQANVAERCRNLANAVLAQLASTGLRNLGPVSTVSNQYFDEYGNPLDYYAINRHCANRGIPGVIVEHCFMDHDVTYIDSPEKISRLGVLDAIGIANYLGLPPK